MIRLTTATLTKLRERLRDRGSRPSLSEPGAPVSDQQLAAGLAEEYGPLCDVMHVMMASDGEIAGAERDVIRGALREMDARIRSVHVEAMLSAAARRLDARGRDGRIADLASQLADDPVRAEAAFMLAAAVAFADDKIVQDEKDVLNQLALAFRIDRGRASALFDSLERVDGMLGQDASIDAGDLLLHTAMRVSAPEDFERLAAMSQRADVKLLLRLYACFVRSGEEMRERAGTTPRSLSAARVAALKEFADALLAGGGATAVAMGATLAGLARALDVADKTTALRPLVTGATPEQPSPMASLEEALARLAQLSVHARRQFGETLPDGPTSMATGDLASTVGRVVRDEATARTLLVPGIEASVRLAQEIVPAGIAETIALVLRRVATLPVERPSLMARPAADGGALPAWLPNKRTLGGFYVLSQLGEGGTATVFVVTRSDERDEPDAERFALKVPMYDATAARTISEAEYLKLFREEAGALLSLPEHGNICRFISFDAAARPKPVLVMELVVGTTCEDAVAAGTLTTARALSILDGVLAGLQAMHGVGVGHLDLKPSNVVLRAGTDPVLVDFGLAGRQLRPGCGTAFYCAPEVWGVVPDGARATPLTADVYGFGCVAYELLTGKPLFDAPDVLAVVTAHVTHDGRPAGVAKMAETPSLGHIAALISHCLRHDPRHRPDVAALRAALRNVGGRLAHLPWPLG